MEFAWSTIDNPFGSGEIVSDVCKSSWYEVACKGRFQTVEMFCFCICEFTSKMVSPKKAKLFSMHFDLNQVDLMPDAVRWNNYRCLTPKRICCDFLSRNGRVVCK